MSWTSPVPQPQAVIHHITCVTRAMIYGRLVKTHLSGPEGTWAYNEVIAWIDTGNHRFFTSDGWNTAEIEVHTSPDGIRYLQTVANGQITDNLDRLPNC